MLPLWNAPASLSLALAFYPYLLYLSHFAQCAVARCNRKGTRHWDAGECSGVIIRALLYGAPIRSFKRACASNCVFIVPRNFAATVEERGCAVIYSRKPAINARTDWFGDFGNLYDAVIHIVYTYIIRERCHYIYDDTIERYTNARARELRFFLHWWRAGDIFTMI